MNRATLKYSIVKFTMLLTILGGFLGSQSAQAGIIPWAYDVVFGPVGSMQRGYYRGAAYGGAPLGDYAGYAPMAVSYAASPRASSASCSRCRRCAGYAPNPYFAGYAVAYCGDCCANSGCGGCGSGGGCASGNCGSNCTTNAAPSGPVKAMPDLNNPPLYKPPMKPPVSGTFDDNETYVSPKPNPKGPAARPNSAVPADDFLPANPATEPASPPVVPRNTKPVDPKTKPAAPVDDGFGSTFDVKRPNLDDATDSSESKKAMPTKATPVDDGNDPRNLPRGLNLDTRITWTSNATPERMAVKARFGTPSIVKSDVKPNADWTPLPKSETHLAAQK